MNQSVLYHYQFFVSVLQQGQFRPVLTETESNFLFCFCFCCQQGSA